MLGPVFVDHDPLRVIFLQHGVVGADALDEAAVAGTAGIGDHDTIERAFFGAASRQSDFQ